MNNSDPANLLRQRSFLELKRKFVNCGYEQSHISRSLLENSEDIPENLEYRLTILEDTVLIYRQWVEEWHQGWKNECFASLPILFIPDKWLEQGEEIDNVPYIVTSFTSKSNLCEPGDYALAIQCRELPEVLNQIRWLSLMVCRDNNKVDG